MKDILINWRHFRHKNNLRVLDLRLNEAITRRQFLGGSAASALLYALMKTSFFQELTDEEQDKLIDADMEDLVKLPIDDPEYAKAVKEYEQEEIDDFGVVNGNEYKDLSDKELKDLQVQKVNALMIAPEKLEDNRPWTLAPVFQSRDFGRWASATELDVELIADTNPEIRKAVDLAYDFYKSFGVTRLSRYVFGNQSFFSYTTPEQANQKIMFDTIEIDKTEEDPFTGRQKNIKFKKLPLAWTIANKVLMDQISLMDAELKSAKGDPKKQKEIYDRYGLTVDYRKNKIIPQDEVAQKLLKTAGTTLRYMQQEQPVVGKHSK